MRELFNWLLAQQTVFGTSNNLKSTPDIQENLFSVNSRYFLWWEVQLPATQESSSLTGLFRIKLKEQAPGGTGFVLNTW